MLLKVTIWSVILVLFLVGEGHGGYTPEECPAGSGDWPDVLPKVFDGVCHLFVKTRMWWSHARNYCRSKGGDLVVISNMVQISVFQKIADFRGMSKFWIGAHDGVNEMEWKWVTGETVTWANWASGQPSCGVVLCFEDCAAMYASSGQWVDEQCDDSRTGVGIRAEKLAFVCQMSNGAATSSSSTTTTTPSTTTSIATTTTTPSTTSPTTTLKTTTTTTSKTTSATEQSPTSFRNRSTAVPIAPTVKPKAIVDNGDGSSVVWKIVVPILVLLVIAACILCFVCFTRGRRKKKTEEPASAMNRAFDFSKDDKELIENESTYAYIDGDKVRYTNGSAPGHENINPYDEPKDTEDENKHYDVPSEPASLAPNSPPLLPPPRTPQGERKPEPKNQRMIIENGNYESVVLEAAANGELAPFRSPPESPYEEPVKSPLSDNPSGQRVGYLTPTPSNDIDKTGEVTDEKEEPVAFLSNVFQNPDLVITQHEADDASPTLPLHNESQFDNLLYGSVNADEIRATPVSNDTVYDNTPQTDPVLSETPERETVESAYDNMERRESADEVPYSRPITIRDSDA